MSKAQQDNVQWVCADHAPRPNPEWQKFPLPWFVGKCVKRAFAEHDHIEHMWVRVTGVDGSRLIGLLANPPASLTNVTFGDPVIVELSEIEAVASDRAPRAPAKKRA